MALVTPNKTYFATLCKDRKRDRVADDLGISPGTLRQCLRGEDVTSGIISHIAEIRRCPATELIVRQLDTLLPDQPEFFESLKFGWWIDNDRRFGGKPRWFTESIELCRKKKSKSCFIGRIVNHHQQVFQIMAERRNDYHFSLTATCEADKTTWDGCLTVCKGNVLCGIWSGYPGHLVPTVSIYRYFMSADLLNHDDIKKLTEQVKIECFSETENFAYDDTHGDED